LSDVDGNLEDRRGTTSAFTGPKPTVSVFGSANGEVEAVGDLLQSLLKDGYKAHEIGVFVRSEKELGRARSAVEKAGLQLAVLDDKVSPMSDHVAVSTMHLAKGLEFRAVIVMACDDEVIPLQARIETVTDDSDLEEVYNTERQLLYVACTRARDVLHVSGVDPASEFLDDLGMWVRG
jgi:superfamily I DNA/RNA helicase